VALPVRRRVQSAWPLMGFVARRHVIGHPCVTWRASCWRGVSGLAGASRPGRARAHARGGMRRRSHARTMHGGGWHPEAKHWTPGACGGHLLIAATGFFQLVSRDPTVRHHRLVLRVPACCRKSILQRPVHSFGRDTFSSIRYRSRTIAYGKDIFSLVAIVLGSA
jgi:hypothetical protein